MPTTASGVPYPAPGEANDAPADFYALADWLETKLGDVLPLTSGVYTPAVTAVSNIDSASGAPQSTWMRIGDVVHVAVTLAVDTTAAGAALVEVSLPVPSNLGDSKDVSGVASHAASTTLTGGVVSANAATNRAVIFFTSSGTVGGTVCATFSYRVLP